MDKFQALQKVEKFIKSKILNPQGETSKLWNNLWDDLILSKICIQCGNSPEKPDIFNVSIGAAKMIANRLATKYIPGYKASKKIGKNLLREVRLKYLYLSESKAVMWYHLNKHKPLVLFGLLKWVNVYKVTRHYGGPEEGGWWYDQYYPIANTLTLNRKAQFKKEALAEEYKGIKHGDISSVRGGADVSVYIEDKKGKLSPSERPYFS